MKEKNVMIPLSLMNDIIELIFGHFDSLTCNDSVFQLYQSVTDSLIEKSKRIKLRDSYANLIFAKDEHERFDARLEYLKRKDSLKNYS